jgi:hypothetical protein
LVRNPNIRTPSGKTNSLKYYIVNKFNILIMRLLYETIILNDIRNPLIKLGNLLSVYQVYTKHIIPGNSNIAKHFSAYMMSCPCGLTKDEVKFLHCENQGVLLVGGKCRNPLADGS